MNTRSGTQWEAYYRRQHCQAGYTGRRRRRARQLDTTGGPEPRLEIGWGDVQVVPTLRPAAEGEKLSGTVSGTVSLTVAVSSYALDNLLVGTAC